MSTFPSLDDGDFELFALGALGPEEDEKVRRAIENAEGPERDEMLRRIADAEEAAAALVEAADLDEAPPARVRAAVLGALPGSNEGSEAGSNSDSGSGPESEGGASRVDPEAAEIIDGRARFRPLAVLAAASLAVVIGGAVAVVALRSGEDATNEVAGPETSATRDIDPGADGTDAPSKDPSDMVDEIMADPDARVTDSSLGSGMSAKVMASTDLDMAVLEISGMPAADHGMHYQLWLNGRGPQPVAGGPLSMSGDGRTLMGGIAGLASTSGVAVTQEPNADPNPTSPTGAVLMEMDMR